MEDDGRGNKTGPHRIEEKVYRAGETIETDQPLDKLFRNKFIRLPDGKSKLQQAAEDPPIPEPSSSAKNQDDVEDEDKTLEETKSSTSSKKKYDSKYGANATADFPDAELLKVEVYHNEDKDWFYVIDESDREGTKVILKRSRSRKNITRYLEKELD